MVAILYTKDGYDTSGKRLMGRHAAGEGFLKALSRHGSDPILYCFTPTQPEYEAFCQTIQPWLNQERTVTWIPTQKPGLLSRAGVLYRPDPLLVGLAWQRRYRQERGYSLCGVTHTIASKETMDGIGQWLTAPLYPWDAIICTSETVKMTVTQLLHQWGEYLAQRFQSPPIAIQPQLPVIPLGVNCDELRQTPALRQQIRQQLGIPPADMVVLFLGRLVFNAKAHPVPMYMAVKRAAEQAGVKVHLIQAGWFENEKDEKIFYDSAQKFAPGVRHIFLDGRQPNTRRHIWAAADVFISLSDNVQETFGLTPVEAMAAGLPVVVSDWDGYRETVRDGVDGFRIPTTLPPAAAGMDLAAAYWEDSLNYSTTVGLLSLMTAVDIPACTAALTRLFQEPDLRRQMGEQGQTRARERYDWAVVIAQYEQLWAELNERRTHAPELPPPTIPHPLCDDPFRLNRHYPTQVLGAQQKLGLGAMAVAESWQLLQETWMTHFGSDRRSDSERVAQIFATLENQDTITVGEIIQRFGGEQTASQLILWRTLVYLLKFDILALR